MRETSRLAPVLRAVGMICIVFLAALFTTGRAQAADAAPGTDTPLVIVYPRYSDDGEDTRSLYPLGLLRLALDKMGVRYELRPSERVMGHSRAIAALRAGAEVNIVWTGTTAEMERELNPIRMPLTRGLLGHRLFIIRKADQDRFSAVRTLEDLRRLTAVQGMGWPDVDIMRAAGLPVEALRYDLLYSVLQHGRVDYLPRSAFEIYGELASRQAAFPDLTVEKSLVLVYPFDMYFFTRKEDSALARIVERGLLQAYQDGSFLKYFNNAPFIRQLMANADLEGRRRIVIPNPLQSPETAALPSNYWLGGQPP
ncbi:transporter substrate-binding domain-containing protein [Nitrospirillum sp. BR 11828]|uniref:substrate-binding periplasmic protein n=1 Tax=Nitrospirillum sp. BR 11828 TaxID=3104325 RepID=UPI002ACADF93|nr:transporter substrate-binding domain-containing protein [Nitrospirillum sp. BR 11828]MDZ5650556.1 transporter substrate-binding domain-containing protein [Nitrospirillum sp. BR 11828]